MDERFAIRTYDENGNRIYDFDESLGWFEWTEGEQNDCGEWVMTRVYHLYSEEELAELSQIQQEKNAPTPQDDTDAMLIDHEYRLTLLELGLSE